jgi:hypothetical protein
LQFSQLADMFDAGFNRMAPASKFPPEAKLIFTSTESQLVLYNGE